jgi:hypothetical protein
MAERIYINDTALVDADIVGEDGVNPLTASTVEWTFKKPDGTAITGGPQTVTESVASIVITDTDLPGLYTGQITFVLSDSSRRSVISTFQVIDPLQTTEDSTTPLEAAIDRAWMKLEDLFDSDLGGPWLRDRTLSTFDREKMFRLLPDALYNINNSYQPALGYDDTSFPFNQHSPLLSQALLVESIYHLMRSYVEQPNPLGGGNITYFDRRDYLNRWQSILQGEEEKLNKWLDLFKRDQMGFGSSSVLVGGYASFAQRYPRFIRGRFPYNIRW